MNRIKNDFIHALKRIGLPEIDSKKILYLFIKNITNGLMDHHEIHIVNFGKFKVVNKKKTSFINPKTKKISKINGIKKVKFTPSKNLNKLINQ
jgi:nucleoid DNA-binding protein